MKGISPLIASVMLIAITVVIAASYGSWFTNLLAGNSDTIANKTRMAIDCTSAHMFIQDVYMDFSRNISHVNVRNSGQSNDNIITVALYNSFGISAGNLSSVPKFIRSGDSLTFDFNISATAPACGNFSRAQVASQCRSDTFASTPKGC